MNKILAFFDDRKKYIPFFIILYIISSFFIFLATYTAVPLVASYGRGSLYYLPTIFTFLVPSFTLIMAYLFKKFNNIANQFKVLKIYAFTLLIFMLISLVCHILDITILFKWNRIYGGVLPLFPFDVLFFQLVFIIFAFILLYFTNKDKDLSKISKTTTEIKKKTIVLHCLYFVFASYFLGLFFSSFFSFNQIEDKNIWGIIPVILTFLLLTSEGIFYFLYKITHSLKIYFIGLLTIFISVFTLLVWIIIAFVINPYLFSESLGQYFYIGYAIKFPLGFYLNIIFVILLLTFSFFNLKKINKLGR